MDKRSLECPVCFRADFCDDEALRNHVDHHFADDGPSVSSCSDRTSRQGTPNAHDKVLTVEEQLRERRKRIAASRQQSSAETLVNLSDDFSIENVNEHIKATLMEDDRALALRVAREADDLELARALQMQEEELPEDVIMIADENDVEIVSAGSKDSVTNRHEDNFGASTSVDSFANNPAMQMEIFQDSNADSGFTSSFGIISRILQILQEDDRIETFLLADEFAHLASDPEDYGWSCGYRNAQMLISALLSIPPLREQWRTKVGGCFVPSILYMQQLMQQAWNAGWDPQGNTEHRYRIIGSKNWLGPVDLYSMLMNLGIECKIVCFVHTTDREGAHPELFQWCRTHFTPRPTRRIPPVYLQHAGHSRTIAGIEVRNNKDQNFIIFDPSTRKEKARDTKMPKSKWFGSYFRRSVASVNKARYEVLCLTGNILSPSEIERNKQNSRSGIHGEIKIS